MKPKVMRSILILLPLVMAGLNPVHAQEVCGDWQGTLSAGNLPLRLVLHIRKGADGTLQATLDSVLRADDRGVAQSTGNFATATTADFATDTEAGVAYLKTRTEIDPNKIGLIGHSEGGVIAPMVAARQREVIALVESEKDGAVLEKELKEKRAGRMPEAQVGAQIHQITSPWFHYFLTYDPAIALRRLSCPVLAINGGKDTQVLPKQNLPPIRKALQEVGNQHFEVDELPGLNHLFQTAKTGAPAEYAEIEETISPIALEKIASWILQR